MKTLLFPNRQRSSVLILACLLVLLAAVQVALAPCSRGRGVLVLMNDQVHCTRCGDGPWQVAPGNQPSLLSYRCQQPWCCFLVRVGR